MYVYACLMGPLYMRLFYIRATIDCFRSRAHNKLRMDAIIIIHQRTAVISHSLWYKFHITFWCYVHYDTLCNYFFFGKAFHTRCRNFIESHIYTHIVLKRDQKKVSERDPSLSLPLFLCAKILIKRILTNPRPSICIGMMCFFFLSQGRRHTSKSLISLLYIFRTIHRSVEQ